MLISFTRRGGLGPESEIPYTRLSMIFLLEIELSPLKVLGRSGLTPERATAK
jgi:hypothetical protein